MKLKKLIPGVVRKSIRSALGGGRTSRSELKPRDVLQSTESEHAKAESIGPVRVLSTAPRVFLSGTPYVRSGTSCDESLGIAGAVGRRYGNTQAGFVTFPTWTIEREGIPEAIKQRLLEHRELYPHHKYRFICNSQQEVELLKSVGLPATFLNKNFMVSEQIFQPLRDANDIFDAIYVARFVPLKRHELAAAVPRVGYVAYVQGESDRKEQFTRLHQEMVKRNPRHVLVNRMENGLPRAMSHKQVNVELNRAAVGLVLSAHEGSSYASMEYMLAGLPVVSTPSTGGRDAFFDPEYCIVCEPTPEAVRDAVSELKSRRIPREMIRARTLAKIQPERDRFLALVDDLVEELGGERRYAGREWPFGDSSGVPWGYFSQHLEDYARASRRELTEELGLGVDVLEGVQLDATELRPMVAAIKSRPGCSLLVFGCGRDSVFWEQINRDGTTAFLEDNPEWASLAQNGLKSASVHVVEYGTKVSDWRRLLDQPAELALDLPEEIGARQWDVIIVDGPAGYDDTQPGRMKSIYTASRRVKPGGYVFVHDSEREAESAFASRYLGDERMYIEAKGRALLKGYAF